MGAKFRQPPFSVAEANIISKSITANGTYNASSDNADGYNPVTVNVPSKTIVSKSITANGTYNASSDSADGYDPVTVNVPSNIQTPVYQDFSYSYIATDGGFYNANEKSNYINVWEVEAGLYLIALGTEVGNRNRCGRKVGYTYNDIEQYLLNSGSGDKIFDMDYVQAYDDALLSRQIVTMTNNGIIILGTSNSTLYSPEAYCVKIDSIT